MSKTDKKEIKSEDSVAQSVESKEKVEKKKPIRRAVVDQRGRLYIDPDKKDKDFVYRFFNDTPGNIERAKDLGYTFVSTDFEIGDGTVNEASEMGGSAKMIDVGKYKGSVKSFLMACPKDTYDERQALKRAENLTMLNSTIESNQRDDQKK